MSASPPSSNPSFSMSAYMMPSNQHSYDSDDEVASLPSETTTESDLETLSDDYSDAEAEWRESIEQLELLLTMVLVPFIGKYMGRKCAYWSWTRFMSWKYPVEVVMRSPGMFKAAGAIEAAATL
ncbi:uncharacterized protein N7484_007203 [Penicillium longicatenatum]|uniref:uncharacterized protein n=1 Tax=Penicillium longicatenatum TaxID=1561947 RepID=UPI002546BE57|nr:uncharacterized protein N7484_007203 [Penicillium longicatenatum]KAJ5639341.1 hypothetical protein N7484_007203 [Penicillium longicatenatum]KAJ5652006.1 hypothetical protein N7507_009432 [Penicillium longicatenatum]